jgi:hypothetical protein
MDGKRYGRLGALIGRKQFIGLCAWLVEREFPYGRVRNGDALWPGTRQSSTHLNLINITPSHYQFPFDFLKNFCRMAEHFRETMACKLW